MLDPDDEQVIKDAKDGGAVMVTWDRVVRLAAGGMTPHEALEKALADSRTPEALISERTQEAIAEASRLFRLSPTDLTVLAREGNKTAEYFRQHIQINRDQAKLVRQLRVDKECSWRAVARACSLLWGTSWGSNQIAGMVICEKAAKLLSEDFMEPPWN